ncbi:hypothetical protein ACFQPA_14325 [Halomarina halobia]|uniref:Uncharacterized protein n=1 Tax=Halomarina halobia TaxID=3033386 RepID=A0ABD6A950_9EURY|nr:hypothetical protein [Halomarina sp. PSR21]
MSTHRTRLRTRLDPDLDARTTTVLLAGGLTGVLLFYAYGNVGRVVIAATILLWVAATARRGR